MDAVDRLKILTSQMHLEPAEDAGCPQILQNHQDDIYVSQAQLPNGRKISLLKTLLTNACERNCYYCPFRAGRDFRRVTFKPDEMAHTFMAIHKTGIAEGIFLSSGVIRGGLTTQDRLLDTADILRNRLNYQGYFHLKIMPGAEKDQVLRAMQLADRVSVNLEAPNTHRLSMLAPKKQFLEELLQPLRWVDEIRRSQSPYHTWRGRWPSSVTQFVMGAVGESDLELLSTTEHLYNQLHLRRTYYSRFNPIKDTPLEGQPPASMLRERRLYNSSFLLRDYGFSLEELPFDPSGNLPLNMDPKLAWAKQHLSDRPVELNRADRHELLRVPGIGPKGAAAILAARRANRLRELADLRKVGVFPERAAPFILLDGHRPVFQASFF